jgi:hypothetical protein
VRLKLDENLSRAIMTVSSQHRHLAFEVGPATPVVKEIIAYVRLRVTDRRYMARGVYDTVH